ncbi:MAG: DUF2905 family protein [Candidatus Dormibacterales bacterium]
MTSAGRLLVAVGGVLLLVGLLMILAGRSGLPGTLALRRGPLTVVFPVLASLAASVVLTVVLNLILRSRG